MRPRLCVRKSAQRLDELDEEHLAIVRCSPTAARGTVAAQPG
jgi:hypothetical protein